MQKLYICDWVVRTGCSHLAPSRLPLSTAHDPMAPPSAIIPWPSDTAVEQDSSSHCPVLSSHSPGEPGPPFFPGAASACYYPQGHVWCLELPHCHWLSGRSECNLEWPFCQGLPFLFHQHSPCLWVLPPDQGWLNPNEPIWSSELIMNNLTQLLSVPTPSAPSCSQFVLPPLAPCLLAELSDNLQQLNLPSDPNLRALTTCPDFWWSQFQIV